MFKHFVVKNYRGFAGVQLKDLARINLIAGMNNTGKTALLEAVHLHNNPADCQLPIAINKARGIADPGTSAEEIVAWHFWGRHAVGGLEVSSWDDRGVNRTLTIWLLDATTSRERFPEAEKHLSDLFRREYVDPNLPRILLEYKETNEPPRVSIGLFVGNGIVSFNVKIPWRIASIYLSSGMSTPDQDMRHFGELEAAKRQDEILPALRILEPRLQRLSLVPLSGTSMIHGDIDLPRLVPMPFMGEGLRRVLSIVMAIANAAGGVVLVDEIENGLHYSVQKKVWQSITQTARRADVQVFATTHSWECIQAAHEAFSEHRPYELKYYRLDRNGDGIEVKSLDEAMLERVQYTDLEIR